jgi:hypothetical protein
MGLISFLGKIFSPTQAQALSVLVVSYIVCSPNWRSCCLLATGCLLVLAAWVIDRWWVPAPPAYTNPSLQRATFVKPSQEPSLSFPEPAKSVPNSDTTLGEASKADESRTLTSKLSSVNGTEPVASSLPFPETPTPQSQGAVNDTQPPATQGATGTNQVTSVVSTVAAAPPASSNGGNSVDIGSNSNNNSGTTSASRRRLHSTSEEPAPSLGGWSPSTYLARFGRFQVLEQPSGRLLAPNTAEPISFENACFVGKMLVLVRTSPEDETHGPYFAGKPRLFEMQIQGCFKQKPKGLLYMGNELPTPHLRLGMVLNATVLK